MEYFSFIINLAVFLRDAPLDLEAMHRLNALTIPYADEGGILRPGWLLTVTPRSVCALLLLRSFFFL